MVDEGISMSSAARKHGVPPSNFLYWCDEDSDLAERYARAQRVVTECMSDEILEIADEPPRLDANGKVDAGDVALRRLRTDDRKWLLSKIHRTKYGQNVTLSGDKENPLQVEQTLDVSKLSTAALTEILAAKNETDNG